MIEKGIPIPPQPKHKGGKPRAEWNFMDVGDSVLVLSVSRASNYLTAFRKLGRKGTTRKVEGGWRVWRTA